ncbi:hypothetical protein AAH446_17315 [Erwinia sp. P6884]|uniref:hypothetical protein n=1 Tax=Erwinia sp. P6884 TaxID=3141450 RepID=UPI003197C3BC
MTQQYEGSLFRRIILTLNVNQTDRASMGFVKASLQSDAYQRRRFRRMRPQRAAA